MSREKRLIAVSLLLGLAAAAGFYLFSSGRLPFGKEGRSTKEETSVKTVRCILAKSDIKMREKIDEKMLAAVDVPEAFAHPDAIRDKKEAIGRITSDRIVKGEILLKQNLRDSGAPSELSFALPADKRAITIEASITGSVGYMVKPGDRVDIILYMTEKSTEEDVSFTLLGNMLVLATDMKIYGEVEEKGALGKVGGSGQESAAYQSVTIAAAPEQCVKLSLAESVGKIKLALHSPLDDKTATGTAMMVSMSDLRRIAGLKAAPDIKSKDAAVVAKTCRTDSKSLKGDSPDGKSATGVDGTSTGKKKHIRNVYILRGTEFEVVTAGSAGDGEYVKRGELK